MNRVYYVAFCLLLSVVSYAQTPGLIFKTAGTGAPVLDPNGDGYTSATTNGFTTNDQSQSEIPYKALIVPAVEPVADPGPGPDCGFTDIVDSGVEDPVLSYFDASSNLLFRFRLGNEAPNSKGYSILIDTDQKFGFSGANADPNAVSGNPGFEIEIVLRTNFGVSLYDVDGTTSPVLKTTLAYANYAQKSVALTTNCGNPDYFYDFFMPFSTITSFFPSINTSTPLRLVAVTSMNPAPAIGNSAVSDVGGIDDQAYGYNYDNIFQTVVDNFYPTPVTGIDGGFPGDRSACPSITSSININTTSISGTSTEATGTVIKVFKNGSLLSSTTVSSGTWTLTGISGLVGGDIITATATATASGKSESYSNCSTITVAATCSSDVTINATNTSTKNIGGTGVVGATIKVYQNGTLVTANPVGSATIDGTGNFCWKTNGNGGSCNSGSGTLSGAYKVTQTESGKCESAGIFVCIGTSTQSTAPVITTTTLLTSTTSVSGTSESGAFVILYAGSTQIGTTTAVGTNWTITGLTFTYGQVITAKAVSGSNCLSNASASKTVTTTSATPSISGNYCTATTVSSISGTTTEASGTTIQVFSNAVSVGTTTSNATGAWTLTGLSLSSGAVITATATATGKLVSATSSGVTIGSKTSNSGLAVNSPISEGQTSVSGTVTGSGTVKIYIDGSSLGTGTVAGSAWSLTGLLSTDLYAGGSVTATFTTPGNCESSESAAVVVQCTAPSSGLTVTPASASVCAGDATSVTIGSSESGIIYQLYIGAAITGVSKLGTGSNLLLTSAALSTSAIISAKALKISPVSCTSTLSSTQGVTVTPVITSNTLTAPSTTLFCGSGNPDVITGSTPSGGSGAFAYQWRSSSDNITFNDIAGAVAKDYDPPVLSATTYYKRVVTSGACSNTSSAITITVQATDLTNTISATGSTVFCVSGDPSQINGSLPTGGTGTYTYQWQSSTDNSAFSNVGGATSQNYDPPSISQTTYFRRLVNSGACTGFPSSSVKFAVATTAETLITASSSSIVANGSSTSILTVQLKDASGNITSSGCTPVLSTTAGTLSGVTDNGNGTYSVTLTSSTTVGVATITGKLSGSSITDNEVVNFIPGPISAVTSTITAASGSIVANGTSTTTVTVQAKDANGNNLTTGGATVTLSTTLGTLGSVTDVGNGTYTAVLTSAASVGTATITGEINATTITDTESVNFINSSADPTTSTITAASNSIVANGTSTTVVTVQAKTSGGVNITTGGASVTLSTTLGTLSVVTDNGNGTYTATLTSATTTGSATISGTLNGTAITDTELVNFIPGPASTLTSTITAASGSIIANGTSTTVITIQVNDANGNNLTVGGSTVTLSTTLGTLSTVTDNGNGTYTATLTSAITSGTATISGTLNATGITDTELVNFTPGPASATTSTISAASNSITADGISTTVITVQAKDANGNNLTTGGSTVTLSTTLGTLSVVIDHGNGTYTATLTSAITTGAATISGTLNATAITDTELVNFTPGPASASTSTITAASNSIVANGISTTVITVQAKDANGNNLSSGGSTVVLNTTLGTISSVVDQGNGQYTATLTSAITAGAATISGTLNATAITDTELVNFTPGPASATTSTITSASNSIIANGVSTTVITVQAIDANGNNLTTGGATVNLNTTSGTLSAITDHNDGTYTATLTSATTVGIATISGTLNATAITDTEAVNFTVGPPANTSTITASSNTINANGTSTTTITVQAKDANGNNLTTGGATVTLNTTLGTLGSVTDFGDGTYSAVLTSAVTVGVATITGTINAIAITDTESVNFINSPADPTTSTITAASNSIVANGTSTTVITVQAKTSGGVNITTGGASVTLSTTSGTLSVVTDNGNGTYTATLTSAITTGTATVSGTLNGTAITDTELINFTPGPASTSTSTITSALGSIIANGISTTVITVQLKDSNGNNLVTGGSTVLLSTTLGSLSSIIDNGNGTYTATLTSSANKGIATISGTLNGSAISDNETVTFAPGPPDPATTLITASSNVIAADGVSTSIITVQLKDSKGNTITSGGATVTLSTTAGTLSAVVDNGDGTYTATLKSSTSITTATITGKLNTVPITDTETVNFSGQLPSALKTLITALPTSIIANGSSTSLVTLQVKDSNGNNLTVGGAVVTLSATAGTLSSVSDLGNGVYTAVLTSSTTAGNSIVSGTVGGTAILDTESVAFTAGPPSVSTSTIVSSIPSITADGKSTTTIVIQLKDAFGNNISSGGANVGLATNNGAVSAVTDNSDGTYTVTLTASTTPGTVVLSGTINGSAMTNKGSVEFTPLQTTIAANPTEIEADGTTTSTITIAIKNSKGNPVSGVVVILETTAGTLSPVVDHGDGTYTATLTSSNTPEAATLSFTVFGNGGNPTTQVLFTSTPATFFIPEGFSPDGDGKNDTFVIQGADAYTVNLTVYNRWGNIVYEAKAYKNDWDGLANTGIVIGDKLPDGTYYYVVDLNNGEKPFVRFLTIKRR